MTWLRQSFVLLLSLLLLISLVGCALAVSVNLALTRPDKIKVWLSQSRLYDHFVANTIAEAKKSIGDKNQSSSISLGDAAVQQSAQSAFPPHLVEQSVNTFLDSNYDWLKGTTSAPAFTIDLAAAKQSFAEQVGQYVRTYSAGLPVCTAAQLLTMQNETIDLLSATCRPQIASPQALGAQTTQAISTSDYFLSNPVITANNLNPKTSNGQGQPYYQKLSTLPRVYRLAIRLPGILGGLAILSALGIVFIAPRKRRGLRRVGIILVAASIILVAIRFIADLGFQKLEHRVFNNASVGQLQQSLTDFASHLESSLIKTDMLISISLLLLAALIFVILWKTRSSEPPAVGSGRSPVKKSPLQSTHPPLILKPPRRPPRLVQ